MISLSTFHIIVPKRNLHQNNIDYTVKLKEMVKGDISVTYNEDGYLIVLSCSNSLVFLDDYCNFLDNTLKLSIFDGDNYDGYCMIRSKLFPNSIELVGNEIEGLKAPSWLGTKPLNLVYDQKNDKPKVDQILPLMMGTLLAKGDDTCAKK